MLIQENISLKKLNTFGIEVKAFRFAEIRVIEEFIELIKSGFMDGPHLILGGGSNVLFTGDFQGIVIKNNISGIKVIGETGDHVYVEAGGGTIWHELVMFCVNNGWGGVENLALIPGTVGAAPMQNIGAYGVELTNVFHELSAVDIGSGEMKTFAHAQCNFGYRESVFKKELKGKYFISSVSLKLNKAPKLNISYGAIKEVLEKENIVNPSVLNVAQAVMQIRRSKLPDPIVLGNAGSFFKNPEVPISTILSLVEMYPKMPYYPTSEAMAKVPAGWMIEQCGWKGKRFGNVGSHKDQALVLVNYGGASGAELLSLANEIRKSVIDKFGIEINPEVNII